MLEGFYCARSCRKFAGDETRVIFPFGSPATVFRRDGGEEGSDEARMGNQLWYFDVLPVDTVSCTKRLMFQCLKIRAGFVKLWWEFDTDNASRDKTVLYFMI